jgi:hypothetical protein
MEKAMRVSLLILMLTGCDDAVHIIGKAVMPSDAEIKTMIETETRKVLDQPDSGPHLALCRGIDVAMARHGFARYPVGSICRPDCPGDENGIWMDQPMADRILDAGERWVCDAGWVKP